MATSKKLFAQWVRQHDDNLYPSRNEKERLATYLGATLDEASRLLANHRRKQLKLRGRGGAASGHSPYPAQQCNKENVHAAAAEQQSLRIDETISEIRSRMGGGAHAMPTHPHSPPLEKGQLHNDCLVTPPPSTQPPPMDMLASPQLGFYGYAQPHHYADEQEQEKARQLLAAFQQHQQQQALIGLVAEAMAQKQRQQQEMLQLAQQQQQQYAHGGAVAAMQLAILQQLVAAQQQHFLSLLSPPLTQTPPSPVGGHCAGGGAFLGPQTPSSAPPPHRGLLDAVERKIAAEHSRLSEAESLAVAVLATGLSD